MLPSKEKIEEAVAETHRWFYGESNAPMRHVYTPDCVRALLSLAQSVIDGKLVEPMSEEEILKIIRDMVPLYTMSEDPGLDDYEIKELAHALSGKIPARNLSRERVIEIVEGMMFYYAREFQKPQRVGKWWEVELNKVVDAILSSGKEVCSNKQGITLTMICPHCTGKSKRILEEDGINENICSYCDGTGTLKKGEEGGK